MIICSGFSSFQCRKNEQEHLLFTLKLWLIILTPHQTLVKPSRKRSERISAAKPITNIRRIIMLLHSVLRISLGRPSFWPRFSWFMVSTFFTEETKLILRTAPIQMLYTAVKRYVLKQLVITYRYLGLLFLYSTHTLILGVF